MENSSSRWYNNIIMDVQPIELEAVNWISVAVRSKPSGFIRGGKHLE